jgi:hypothetical protein
MFYQNTVVLKAVPCGEAFDTPGANTLFWPVSVLAEIDSCVETLIPIDAGLGSKNSIYAVLLAMWPEKLMDTHAVATRQLLMELRL